MGKLANPYRWPHKGLAEWTEGNTAYLSVVFSWELQKAYSRAVWLRAMGYRVRAGGPAVRMNPDALTKVAHVMGNVNALPHHHPQATITTRGCPNKCPFCLVPQIEGDLVELDRWTPRPVVCDNNLLAASQAHFNRVIDRLKPLKNVDFNSGLDARLLTKHHAQRIAELDLQTVRMSWDNVNLETQVHDAIEKLRDAGIGVKRIRVYVLIGFRDTPEDALYRCHTLKKDWGVDPLPMRYQPLDATSKDAYVDENWTERELRNMVRYWWRTRYLGGIPFEEYKRDPAKKPWLRRDELTHSA